MLVTISNFYIDRISQSIYNSFLYLLLKNFIERSALKKFKLYILAIFASAIAISLAGCGTVEGLRRDIRVVGKVLSNA